MYIPELHDMPSTQRAIVPYTAARNPYASSHVTHTSQQKVSHCPSTVSTDGIYCDAQFLCDSTGDNNNKDAFFYHNNFFP
eukprot:6401798-Ditylum_brightwellii.AAC.1